MDNVKVAVRVRPFNARERERNAKCIISMHDKSTTIVNPETNEEKTFTFDYSYWSHTTPADPKFAGQKNVFDDLGVLVLENAWKGYNVSLFAYGQTGSGKSYSMVGYGADRGIIPCACEELFRRIENNTEEDTKFKVESSMLEIYNEKVRDLFNPRNPRNEAGLKLREHPVTGPYIDGLALIPVRDYNHINVIIEEGTSARTVASTQMNATSSRAHTIFTIILTQTSTNRETMRVMDRVAKISLVDLAGSERATSTGATGDRLKEGAAINKSLSALGNCISALADMSKIPKGGKAYVPYRDSTLTWLLKESLGGNAKTIMIAALSPADINYEETLSTLRYADRAKQIVNTAVVNEDPNEKLIRDLREEVENLKRLVAGGAAGSPSGKSAAELDMLTAAARREAEEQAARELEAYKEQLAESQRLIEQLNKSWEEKEREGKEMESQRRQLMIEMGLSVSEEDLMLPQLVNINEDSMKNGAVIYALHHGEVNVGRPDCDKNMQIKLVGLNISKHHAIIINRPENLILRTVGNSRTWVNGQLVQAGTKQEGGTVVLNHNDRLLFGNNHLFRVNFPEKCSMMRSWSGMLPPSPKGGAAGNLKSFNGLMLEPGQSAEELDEGLIDWQFAQRELAMAAGQAELFRVGEREQAMAEEMKAKMAEMEARLEAERQEAQVQIRPRVLEEQRRELELKEEQMHLMVGREREEAQRAVQEHERALAAKTKELEEQMNQTMLEAEALKESQERSLREQEILNDQIIATLPAISEANGISEELDLGYRVELKIVPKAVIDGGRSMRRRDSIVRRGSTVTQVAVAVRVEDLFGGRDRLWSREKFMDRIYSIRDYYHRMVMAESPEEVTADEPNPFEDSEAEMIVGYAHVYLESLYYFLDPDVTTPVLDYKGKSEGQLTVHMYLNALDGEPFLLPNGSEAEHIGQVRDQQAECTIHVVSARGLPVGFRKFCVRYRFDDEGEVFSSPWCETAPAGAAAASGSGGVLTFDWAVPLIITLDEDMEDRLLMDAISFQVWGGDSRRSETVWARDTWNRTTGGGRLHTPAHLPSAEVEELARALQEKEAKLAEKEQILLQQEKILEFRAGTNTRGRPAAGGGTAEKMDILVIDEEEEPSFISGIDEPEPDADDAPPSIHSNRPAPGVTSARRASATTTEKQTPGETARIQADKEQAEKLVAQLKAEAEALRGEKAHAEEELRRAEQAHAEKEAAEAAAVAARVETERIRKEKEEADLALARLEREAETLRLDKARAEAEAQRAEQARVEREKAEQAAAQSRKEAEELRAQMALVEQEIARMRAEQSAAETAATGEGQSSKEAKVGDQSSEMKEDQERKEEVEKTLKEEEERKAAAAAALREEMDKMRSEKERIELQLKQAEEAKKTMEEDLARLKNTKKSGVCGVS